MSHIGRIEANLGVNYLAALAEKTRREDVTLIAEHGQLKSSEADSFALFSALWHCWPTDKFDEDDIAWEAPRDPQLWRALAAVIGPLRARRRYGRMSLSNNNKQDALRWILSTVGKEIGGLRLVRDPIGWCDVVIVPELPR